MSSSNASDKDPKSVFSPGTREWLDYLWIIRDHIFLSMIVAGCISGYYFQKKSQAIPLYKSSAIVLFEIQKDRVINLQEVTDTSIGRGGEAILRNHLTDLRSNSFRDRIVQSLSEEEKEIVRKGYAYPDNPEPNLHGIIASSDHIAQIGGNIFNFEFHHRNPAAAALLANRYTEEFNDVIFERARRSNDSAIRFLRSQSEELKLRVERSELAVQRYRQERNLVSLEESQNLIVERMKNLSSNLNNAKISLLKTKAFVENIEEIQDDPERLISIPAITERGELPAYIARKRNLEAEIRNLSLRYGARHPTMIQLSAALATVQEEIEQLVNKTVSDIKHEYQDAEARIDDLSEALASAEKESLQLDQVAIEYNVLRRKLDTDQRLFTQVHQRLNEALLASQLTDTNLRVVDRAWPSSSPFTPDTAKTTTMTIMIFVLISLGVPFAFHFLNLKLSTANEIEVGLELPYLGEIRKLPRRIKNQERVVLDQIDQISMESFRQVLSQLLLRNKTLKDGHTFIVTSALPKEGKSFFSLNLAASFSRHHLKTLLVDCDFRRPSIAGILKEDLAPMNMNEENRTIGVPQLVRERFYVAPATISTTEATEWLESETFISEFSKFREQFDVIIVDTPPAGLFPDASLIGNLGDQIIFLTQLNKHRKTFLKGVLSRLEHSKAPVVGIVVNKVNNREARHLGGYKYGDYNKYKSYYPIKKKA